MADVAVPTVPPLATLPRVELVQTGRWDISSGRWQPSREDLVQAVAALDCPAVRRPVLKLGHSSGEEPLWAGNPTGAPAVGWVDNLRLENHGHTLVGDFVGMPGWLGEIAASAYPDRSVEGRYDYRCQIGHHHPFVITAVALLGVTPPGVGTLRSLQDVARLYGVTAATGGVVAFDPDQPRDDHGRWTDIPGAGLLDAALDKLKLADRIQLGRGEQLAGSGRVRTDDNSVLLAAIHTPDGPRLRIGTGIDNEDSSRWRAANRGATANLSPQGVQQFRQALGDMQQAVDRGQAGIREAQQRIDRAQERVLEQTRLQYGFNKTEARRYQDLNDEISDADADLRRARRQLDEIGSQLPDGLRQRFRGADSAEQQRILRDHYAEADVNTRDRALFGQARAARLEQDALARYSRALQQQTQMTQGRQPAAGFDPRELGRARAELQAAEREGLEFVDGTVLAEGTIPSEWGDLRYEVQTIGDLGSPDVVATLRVGSEENETDLSPRQLRQLTQQVEELLQATQVEAAGPEHLDGWTLGDSGADLDLWADGTVTLGWGDREHRLGDADGLVDALNRIRGGGELALEVSADSGSLRLLRHPDGGVQLFSDTGHLLLSDGDAYDAQLAIVRWGQPGVEAARVFDPARHPRWPKGTPGGLGGRFMPRDLVPSPSGQSRSRRRTTPPARRRRGSGSTPRRTATTSPEQARTIQILTNLDQAVRRVPGATRGRGQVPSLSRQIRDIRTAVDTGDISPQVAVMALSQLVFRQDVANDSRLSDRLSRAVADLRNTPSPTDTPDAPEPPQLPRPRSGAPDIAELVTQLRSATSRDQATELLQGLTVAQLRALAREAGLSIPAAGRKADVLNRIVQQLVGRRLTDRAITSRTVRRVGASTVEAQVPNRNRLKHYWTRDPEGLAKWATKPHPWTALYRQLRRHVGAARAKRIASQWFKEVFGIWPGERKGRNPAGPG